MSMESSTPALQIVRVKLPEFWSEDVSIWFTQCDVQFHLSKVTSEQTKFDYVIQKLDRDTVKCVHDLIASPPPGDLYSQLRSCLLSCFGCSQYKELLAFHNIPRLSKRHPSVLMDDLLLAIPSVSPTEPCCHSSSHCSYINQWTEELNMIASGSLLLFVSNSSGH